MLQKGFIHVAASAVLLCAGAANADMTIGVSMSQFDDAWLSVLRQGLTDAAAAEPGGVKIQFVDARADVNRQVDQVQDLVSKKIDALIVNPVDTAATSYLTKAAISAKIPLIYVNRRPDDLNLPDGVVTVTSDDVEAGEMQAQFLADHLKGQGKVVVLLGDLANNATHNHTKGVSEVFKKYPGIKIIEEQTGVWQRQKGMDITNDWLTQGQNFDAVLSYNDEMGIGAAMALKQAGVASGKVLVTGSDGTPDGLYAVKTGMLSVSLYQDAKAQAKQAIEAAVKMAHGEKISPQAIYVPYRLITADNADTFK